MLIWPLKKKEKEQEQLKWKKLQDGVAEVMIITGVSDLGRPLLGLFSPAMRNGARNQAMKLPLSLSLSSVCAQSHQNGVHFCCTSGITAEHLYLFALPCRAVLSHHHLLFSDDGGDGRPFTLKKCPFSPSSSSMCRSGDFRVHYLPLSGRGRLNLN